MHYADVPYMRTRGSAAELEQRRRQAVALLEQGLRPYQVAEALGVSRASVTRWKQVYEEQGADALASKPHPGRHPKLTAKQRQRLAKLLTQGPRKCGYATELWTLSRVAELIQRSFGVDYHPCHVWKVLRAMRWTCQKPERRARERNEDAIAQWREMELPRIKKRVR